MVLTASETWATAQKIRRNVVKETDRIQRSALDTREIRKLKDLETVVATYRLACIQTLWADFQYAADQKVEVALWQTHIILNSVYRKLLNKLSSPQQAVLKHQLEKVYKGFLKTSQFFYKGYMQRMCARYKMPELERIARGAQLNIMDVPPEERIDAVAAGIGQGIISSCHHTLTYMGDLSRYRSLYLPHGRNFDICLSFYSLANDLMPDSGYGYHQMGLVFLEEKKHVEIVYHFYRALAAVKPHPNASSNLEVEFRDLLRRDPPRARNPYDAFTFWFVRLHAYYHRGEHFTQRAELEEEVLHRFRMALKADDFGATLLKMVLINICAFQIAQDKINAEWTAAGSRSCQFILGFNIRTIHVIADVLRTEILNLNNQQRDVTNDDGSRKFNPVADAGLPLLRIYMTWLCAYRSDVVTFQEYLEPHIGDMYKTLSQALSGLFELLAEDKVYNMTPPCLLPEDTQTLGLRCLNDPNLPVACRLCIDPITHTLKPRIEEQDDQDLKPDDTSFIRALDIAVCAMTLSRDTTFPFVMSTVAPYSTPFLQLDFLEGGKELGNGHARISHRIDPTTAVGSLTTMFSDLHASPIEAGIESAQHNYSVSAGKQRAVAEGPSVSAPRRNVAPARGQHSAPVPPKMTTDLESAMDRQLSDLVNTLLAPPKSPPKEPAHGQDETSYGMHSDTAQDVFGLAATAVSPGPGSSTKKSFPTLPWDYFFTPSSKQSGLAEHGPKDAWNNAPCLNLTRVGSALNDVTIQGSEGLADPFSPELRNHYPATGPEYLKHQAFGNQEPAFNGTTRQLFAGRNLSNAWDGSVESQMPGSAAPERSPFSSMTFSGNLSSLPPVNSPWGLPANPQLNTRQSPSAATSDMLYHGRYSAAPSQSSNVNLSSAYQNGNGYDAAAVTRLRQPTALVAEEDNSDDDAAFFNAASHYSRPHR